MGTSIETRVGTTRRSGGVNGAPVGTALRAEARPRTEIAVTYQRLADADRGTGGQSLADFLGLLSLGLGFAEVAAPGVVARICGVDHEDETNRSAIRAMGMRELGHGVAILSNPQPAKAVWSRVAGDALDLAFLGKALANPDNARGRTLVATANVLAVTALDVMCAKQLSKQPRTEATAAAERGVLRTRRSITVRQPVHEVYAFWRDFENFPRFMRHLESVTVTGEGRSHWKAKGPLGKSVEWDAVTTEDRPNELLAWRSVEGSDVHNAGIVRFQPAPGGRGTEVRVEIEYDPPLGKLGSKVATLFREEPGQQLQDDLRHFKQVMETGEIVVSDATKQRGPHPAQPDDEPVRL